MFKNLTIRAKLSLLILLMLIPLAYFVINSIYVEAVTLNKLKAVETKLNESDKLSLLLHEVQRERAISNVYVASNGTTFTRRLQNQRKRTDVAIEEINDFYRFTENSNGNAGILNNIQVYRRQVDEHKGNAQYDSYYLSLIDYILSRIESNNTVSEDPHIRRQLQGYIGLINAKQRLGQLRTIIGQIIINKTISNEVFAEYRIQESYFSQQLELFQKNINSDVREFYTSTTDIESVRRSNELISLFKNPSSVNFDKYEADLWYNNFTEYIDRIREVEVYFLKQIRAQLQEDIALRNNIMWIYSAIVLFVIATAIGFALFFLNTTSNALKQLKQAADKVSLGETDIALDVSTGDEIGQLANSFTSLVKKNLYLSAIADEIGKGNYDQQVTLAGPNDVLGNAIRNMQQNLKRLSEENARRNWMLTGSNRLDDAIRGIKTLEKLTGEAIENIVKYVEAQLGGIYMLNEQSRLEFINGYAFNLNGEPVREFALGEGPLGQAVASNDIIVLDNIQQTHLKIQSGLLDVAPASVAFVPLRFGEELVGALEIAKKDKFAPQHLEFLDTIKEKIAMVILSLKADLKTAELLYETQNQAEELETQQEELRQINDELREQSIRLQASEEELKTNQEELMEKNAELEEKANQLEEQYEAIRVKNTQLEEAREAISTKVKQVETISKYKSEFLANMSHELRTPLNSILILAKLIEENKEKNLTPKQVEFASVIHNSGSDLLKLINEILDLAKIESGKINLDLKEVELESLEVQAMFSQLAKEKDISFSAHFDERLPATIYTDEFRLQQILRNLLSNAFKFTPAGGQVALNIKQVKEKNIFINENLLKADNIIAFEVKDTGIGIPEDKQQIIFEAFQQADTSTTRKFGGTGLGLSISRELAALLGGEIHLQSKENIGSTFTLYLPQTLSVEDAGHLPEPEVMPAAIVPVPGPAAKQPSITELFTAKSNGQPRKNRLILIIEDDKGFSKILADFSKDRNFNVVTTTSGEEGVKLAKQHKPDAILLDIQLPDISGWEVLERIKRDKTISHTPVHVMSAYDSDVLQKGLSSEDFLPKPITLEMLDKAFNKIQHGNKQLQQILIIEDNEVENKAINELLLAHDMHSVSAHTGVEALQMIAHKQYDCVILDINLPDMEGFELLEQLRRKESYKDTPVVIYSGRDLTESEEFRLKKHANTIIIKTMYSYTRLLEEVKLFLHKVQERIPLEKETQLKLHRAEAALQGKKVLIVDDDSRNIYSLYNIFEGQQMDIIVANDGQEALDQLNEHPDTDIVLMDIMMPVMDGMECMRQIRKQARFNKLPIIALTAKAMKGDREKSIEAGASDYIPKPVDVDKLLSLMRVWLYDSKAGL